MTALGHLTPTLQQPSRNMCPVRKLVVAQRTLDEARHLSMPALVGLAESPGTQPSSSSPSPPLPIAICPCLCPQATAV